MNLSAHIQEFPAVSVPHDVNFSALLHETGYGFIEPSIHQHLRGNEQHPAMHFTPALVAFQWPGGSSPYLQCEEAMKCIGDLSASTGYAWKPGTIRHAVAFRHDAPNLQNPTAPEPIGMIGETIKDGLWERAAVQMWDQTIGLKFYTFFCDMAWGRMRYLIYR